ncbi:MAG: cation-transporting P-type ATPase [Bacteroidetes bacterium]|nr:MAG: cation-transporting P-type ATPase [Bacteroidota bacterium]
MNPLTGHPDTEPHSLAPEHLAARLETNYSSGLSEAQAALRIREIGPNEIPKEKPPAPFRILLNQIMDPVILILIGASCLAYFFEDSWQGTAILVVIVISVAIGFFMEARAYRTLEALRKLGQSRIRLIRSGKTRSVRIAELVPGDLVLLSSGDVVPADLRLLEAEQLSIKESALTGESLPTWKREGILPADTPLVQRTNMLYKGTTVMTGSGIAVVTGTGLQTELGKIQQLGIASGAPHTPLEKKLKALTLHLIWLTAALAALIMISGVLRGASWVQMLETSLALAVAAIPEGLPIVATIALARGMFRLSRRQVVVKNLEAIQTLGATDIILTDKTGTLTEDALYVRSIRYGQGMTSLTVPSNTTKDLLSEPGADRVFDLLMHTGVLCNNVKEGQEGHRGDSLEAALIDFAVYAGFDVRELRLRYPEIWEFPFDAQKKFMATIHGDQDGYVVHAKGAFKVLAEDCTHILGPEGKVPFTEKEAWEAEVSRLAARGLRTLAFAFKTCREPPVEEDALKDLVFLGVIGFMDPVRKDIRPVFEVYRKAGIRVVMVTGDHPRTAQRIAEEVGLVDSAKGDSAVFEGGGTLELRPFDQARVFARVLPEEKLDLVARFQEEGHIVGMIGDGINDVPALKKADIGIAMGVRGTEAAREASDVILKDDSFGAIELAIRQGRVVFRNIRQFVLYLLSCNLAEILAVAVAALGNLPAPLLPLQILFLNLVTDVFPALALGLGRGPADIMERPPGNPKDPILNRADWIRILLYGLAISISVLGAVLYGKYCLELTPGRINNLAFYTLVGAQLFHVFNLTERHTSFFRNEITGNPYVWGAIVISIGITAAAYWIPPVATVLQLEQIYDNHLGIALLFSFGSVLLVQLLKLVLDSFHNEEAACP